MGHRLTVAAYFINQGYTVCKVLHLTPIHKTTWYRFKHRNASDKIHKGGRPIPGFSYHKLGHKINDEQIIQSICKIRHETYTTISGGYKKIKYYLFKDIGVVVNHKKVYRLCKENNLLLPKITQSKHARRLCINRRISKIHQVWEFDIKYGYIHGQNQFFIF